MRGERLRGTDGHERREDGDDHCETGTEHAHPLGLD
jgi:hypothetical protein